MNPFMHSKFYFKQQEVTIQSSLRSIKDLVDPKSMKGVYMIPCSGGTPYIGETDRLINQRIHEHATYIKHYRTRSSALAEDAKKQNTTYV